MGLPVELTPRSTKLKCIKIQKCLQWMCMESFENNGQLVCTKS